MSNGGESIDQHELDLPFIKLRVSSLKSAPALVIAVVSVSARRNARSLDRNWHLQYWEFWIIGFEA